MTTTGGLFGGAPTGTAAGLLNAPPAFASTPSAGLFGTAATTSTATSSAQLGLFGAPAATAAAPATPAGGLFGGTAANKDASATPAAGASSGTGPATTSTAAVGGLFGTATSSAAAAPAAGLFGAPATSAPAALGTSSALTAGIFSSAATASGTATADTTASGKEKVPYLMKTGEPTRSANPLDETVVSSEPEVVTLYRRLEAHIGKEKRSRDEVKKLLSAQDDEAAEGNRTLETVGQKLRDVKSNNEGTGIGMAKEEDLKASIKTGMNRCREDAIGHHTIVPSKRSHAYEHFGMVVQQIEDDMKIYRRHVTKLECFLKPENYGAAEEADALQHILVNQKEIFLELSAKLQGVHERLEKLYELYQVSAQDRLSEHVYSGPSRYGQYDTQQKAPKLTFGYNQSLAATTVAPAAGLFGTATSAGNAPAFSGLFGATATSTTPAAGLFGAPTAAAPATGLFGAPTAAAPAAGLFGAPTAAAPATGLFGAPTAAAPATGLFGAPTAAAAAPAAAAPAEAGLFGASAKTAAAPATGGLFGTPNVGGGTPGAGLLAAGTAPGFSLGGTIAPVPANKKKN